MEDRYRRLADLCERRRRWLQEWHDDKLQRRLAFDDEFEALKRKIKRLWVHGMKTDAIVAECSTWDEAIVRYWIKQTDKGARQGKGPDVDSGPFQEAHRRSTAATGL